MKAGDMATLTAIKSKKNVYVLSSLDMSVELSATEKKKPRQLNFITRPNVALTWLIKCPSSIQSK